MFCIGEGDLEKDMVVQATINDEAEDISDATDLVLRQWKPDGTTAELEMTAVDLAEGKVKRVWAEGDTDVPGTHRGQLVCNRGNGEQETFPSKGYYKWHVQARIPAP